MASQSDPFQRLCSIDRDLQFFNADEQQHHLGLLTSREHRQLHAIIKKVHQHIQKITNLQRTTSAHSSITNSSMPATANGLSAQPRPPPQQHQHQQQSATNEFFRHKQVKQLYLKLKVIKERYSAEMLAQKIRALDSDMERYQQLQEIQSLSGRLDVSSQLYDELQHLRHSLTSLRREWKLDRIQDVVSTLATSPSSSPSSPISPLLLIPPSSSTNTASTTTITHSLSEQHGHRWYPSLNKKKWPASSSTSSFTNQSNHHKGKHGLVGVMKNWFKQHSLTGKIGKASETTMSTDNNTTTTTTTTTELGPSPQSSSPPAKKKQRHRHRLHYFGQRAQPHQHLIHCSSQEECRIKIQQLIHDFYGVFEANARQNEQRMHQLYARVFQQEVDPMLAEDMQRLCLAVSAAPPPSLASLLQPGLSSAFGTFCVTSESMRDSFLITEHDKDALDNMIFWVVTPPASPPSPPPSSFASSRNHHHHHHQATSRRTNHRNWIKAAWGITTSSSTKQRQHNKQKQTQSHPPSSSFDLNSMQQLPLENTGLMQNQQQQQQGWSICLGLVSEYLLHIGQQYYTNWIHELIQAQHQQAAPFQFATETLASMYRALQIEQGHAILSRLCTQLESSLP